MIDQLIKGMALFEGSNVHTSNRNDALDYSSYTRLFRDEDVKEITVTKEDSLIYAKKYDKIIIILNLNNTGPRAKVGSHSFLLLRARAICRDLNALYTTQSPQLGDILRYRIELKSEAFQEVHQDSTQKETKTEAQAAPVAEKSEQQYNNEGQEKIETLKNIETVPRIRQDPLWQGMDKRGNWYVPPGETTASGVEKAETVKAESGTEPLPAEPKLEKIESRFKKKEPLVVRMQPGEELVAEKTEPQTVGAEEEELQAQVPQKQVREAKPKLFDSLAMDIYQGPAKKETKKPKNKAQSSAEEKKADSAVEGAGEKREPAVAEGAPSVVKAEDEEELLGLAKEIIRFKKAWAEKKK